MSDFHLILQKARQNHSGHHNIYVVQLNKKAKKKFGYLNEDSGHPVVYVGLTGLTPSERFEKHKNNDKAGKGYVRDYGVSLLPHLYEEYNPSPYELAKKAEGALADKLRADGYTVLGGH
ncbi:MAG: hypothetical protein IPM53_29950 [Anaerolineaceae bacterium]|nr:hypothetical protein [Anaerolineaceae bacterium]